MSSSASVGARRWLKSIPGVRWLHRTGVRWFRRSYWRANVRGEDQARVEPPNLPAQVFASRMQDALAGRSVTVLEMGCGNAHDLLALAQALPQSRFIGVDLRRQSIDAGLTRRGELAVSNVELHCGDILEVLRRAPDRIDVFCACAALIYLSESEVRTLFRLLIAKGVCRWLFCEVTARGARSLKKHIFVHAYDALLHDVMPDRRYEHVQEFFSYEPWEAPDYQGAMHSILITQV